MPTDKDGRRHAHRSSGGSRSGKSRSDSHPPNPNPTPRRRPSNLSRDTHPPATNIDKQTLQTVPGHSSNSSGSSAASLSTARPASSYRDSFHSILEDPFFQNYDANPSTEPIPDSPGERSPIRPAPEGDEKNTKKRWPPPRRDSLTTGSSQFWVCHCCPALSQACQLARIGP